MYYEPAKAVANFFILQALQEGVDIEAIKIQKLVYLAHGWNLAFTGYPPIKESIRVRPFGPIIEELYGEFVEFGASRPVNRFASDIVRTVKGDLVEIVSRLHDAPSTIPLLTEVWAKYKHLTYIQLANMANAEGSPWRKIKDEAEGRTGYCLPNELMEEHFKGLIAKHKESKAND
jgi:uncharacterized phage-associated protein